MDRGVDNIQSSKDLVCVSSPPSLPEVNAIHLKHEMQNNKVAVKNKSTFPNILTVSFHLCWNASTFDSLIWNRGKYTGWKNSFCLSSVCKQRFQLHNETRLSLSKPTNCSQLSDFDFQQFFSSKFNVVSNKFLQQKRLGCEITYQIHFSLMPSLSKSLQARIWIPVSDYKHPGMQLTAHSMPRYVFLWKPVIRQSSHAVPLLLLTKISYLCNVLDFLWNSFTAYTPFLQLGTYPT